MELLPSFSEYIANAKTVRLAHLLTLELTGIGSIYITDYGKDIVLNGNVYTAGRIKDVGTVRQSREFNTYDLSIKTSGVSEIELARVLNSQQYLNRTVTVYRAYLDLEGNIIPMFEDGSTLKYFEGIITKTSVQDSISSGGAGSSVITWTCSSEFSAFKKVNGRISDDASHRGLESVGDTLLPSTAAKRVEYQSDLGFQHANKSISVLAQYQTYETRYKTKTKKNWLGMIKSVTSVPYQVEVTAEVDLNYDLTAQYIPVVYGVRNVEGNPIFVDTLNNDPDTVYVVYAMCEGEIEGFMDFYIDDSSLICWDESTSDSRTCYGLKRGTGSTVDGTGPTQHGHTYTIDDGYGEIEFTVYHGKADQTASSILVDIASGAATEINPITGEEEPSGGFYLQQNPADGSDPLSGEEYWGTQHRLLDTAYIIAKFQLTEDRTTIPDLSADVRGKIVDTYDSSGDLVVGTKTTTNPSWQILDYMLNTRHGGAIPQSRVNLKSFYDSAQLFNVIDESYEASWVPYWNYVGWESQDDSERAVLQTNVQLLTEQTVFKNISVMLEQVDAALNITAGYYTLSVQADMPTVADITAIVSGDLSLTDSSTTDKYNAIQASLLDPATEWASNQITFYNSEYKEEDNNVENKGTFLFPYITNYYTARAAAERFLKASRAARELSFTLPFTYALLGINDHITFTHARYGWDKKRFMIQEIEWNKLGQIKVVALEYLEGMFINSQQFESNYVPGNGITYAVLPVTNLIYTPYIGDSDVGKNGTLTWTPSKTSNISYYTIKLTGGEEAKTYIYEAPRGSSTATLAYPLTDLDPDTYSISVRAVDYAGGISTPTTITVVVSASQVLDQVTNFRITNMSNLYTGSWIGSSVNFSWDELSSLTGLTNPRYNLVISDEFGNTLRDVSIASGTTYSYLLTYNKADYLAYHGSQGVTRRLTAKIKAKADVGIESASWSSI
jgi:hypothetical protein